MKTQHTPEVVDLIQAALDQLEKMDFTCSPNWNGSLKTNASLLLACAISKALGNEVAK